MKTRKGYFLTFEGGEGCGKSTVVKILAEWLKADGWDVLVTREPGGVDISERIRTLIVDNEMDVMTEALLFAASRNEITKKVIEPAIQQGKVVLCDRFIDSSFVYQGLVKRLGIERIYQFNQPILERIQPDLTFVLDLDPRIGLERIRKNGRETNKFDEEDILFHERVRRGYLSLREWPGIAKRLRIVPADQKPEDVARQCLHYFYLKLGKPLISKIL